MKRFVTLVLFLSLASTAQASGVGLRWGSCEGASNRNFACDRSSGTELLVGSFQPPGGINQLSGIEVILSIAAAEGKVPSWWQTIDAGACRRGGIAASFDVSDQTECNDPWSGAAMGGMGFAAAQRVSGYNFGDASGLALYLTAAVPQDAIQGVQSGTTYAAFKLIINHQKSNGPSACSGCDTPVCIRLDGIRLVQPGRLLRPDDKARTESYVDLTDGIGGMGGASQVVTWQGGTSNCAAGLAKTSTWSELKSRFKTK